MLNAVYPCKEYLQDGTITSTNLGIKSEVERTGFYLAIMYKKPIK